MTTISASHAVSKRFNGHEFAVKRRIEQQGGNEDYSFKPMDSRVAKKNTADHSSDALEEVSAEVREEEMSITSQESGDELSKYVAHHIDGYGSITSCNDGDISSAGRDIDSYESVDLEITFDYQMELISLLPEEDSMDAFDELIASTERTMHKNMVDSFLDCGMYGATEGHGMDRRRQLATVDKSKVPSPLIVGISSAPQDAISLADACTSVHTNEDACVVVNAAATVTVEMDGITNAKLLSAAIDTIRSAILKNIEAGMKQGQYDGRYGPNIFAKISFARPNHTWGDVAPPLIARSSLPENEVGDGNHDPSTAMAASLRGKSNVRHRRRNVRAIVVVIGMLTIVILFQLISFNRDLRSRRSDSQGKKSWSWRHSGAGQHAYRRVQSKGRRYG